MQAPLVHANRIRWHYRDSTVQRVVRRPSQTRCSLVAGIGAAQYRRNTIQRGWSVCFLTAPCIHKDPELSRDIGTGRGGRDGLRQELSIQ